MWDWKLNLINSLTLILGGGGFAIDNVANKPFTQECTDLPTTPATSDTTVPTEPPQSKSIMGSNIFSKIDPMEGFRGIFLNCENEHHNKFLSFWL